MAKNKLDKNFNVGSFLKTAENQMKKVEKAVKQEKKEKITINTSKIGSFLKSLNDAELRYLEMTMNVAISCRNLIRKHKLDKKTFCDLFAIKTSQYNDFIKGNRNYSLKDWSKLNAVFMELESKALEDKVPVQVTKTKDFRTFPDKNKTTKK